MAKQKHTVLAWVILLVLLAPLLLAGYVALEVLFLTEYRHDHGLSYRGAGFKWHTAMNDGDAEGAKYWAERMVRFSSPGDEFLKSREAAYRCLAAAHELAGEYEEALALYKQYPGRSRYDYFSSPLAQARVYHKMDRSNEAFCAYCEWGAAGKERTGGSMGDQIQRTIVGGFFPYEKALSPFGKYDHFGHFATIASYDRFLSFMRREWEKTGNAEEFRDAMQYFESMR